MLAIALVAILIVVLLMLFAKPSTTKCFVMRASFLVTNGSEVIEEVLNCSNCEILKLKLSLKGLELLELQLNRSDGEVLIRASARYPYSVCSLKARASGELIDLETVIATSGVPLRSLLISDKYLVKVRIDIENLSLVSLGIDSYTSFFSGCPHEVSTEVALRRVSPPPGHH